MGWQGCRGDSTLPVQYARPNLAILAVCWCKRLSAAAAVALDVEIVKICYQGQTYSSKKDIAVGVEQIGLVVIYQVFDAFEVMHLPRVRSPPVN